MTLLEQVFSVVCGQQAQHTWAPEGVLLPFCQRCTGFYAGAFLALLAHLLLRIRLSTGFIQVHGAFLLMMIPLGFHWIPHGSIVRTMSGLLYGFGVVTFLWLIPGRPLCRSIEPGCVRHWLYAGFLSFSLALVPALAISGSRRAGLLLEAMASAGLAGISALLLINLWTGLAWVISRRHVSRI